MDKFCGHRERQAPKPVQGIQGRLPTVVDRHCDLTDEYNVFDLVRQSWWGKLVQTWSFSFPTFSAFVWPSSSCTRSIETAFSLVFLILVIHHPATKLSSLKTPTCPCHPHMLIFLKMSPWPKEVSKFPDQYPTSKTFWEYNFTINLFICLFINSISVRYWCIVDILCKWKMFKDKICKVGNYKIYFIDKNFVLNKIMKTMSLFITLNNLSSASLL